MSEIISCFSALQRAENFSIRASADRARQQGAFQCSSASRKFLNSESTPKYVRPLLDVSVLFSEPKISQFLVIFDEAAFVKSFSALQRAENFSIFRRGERVFRVRVFQCSSASRKFLNPDPRTCIHPYSRPR